MISLLALVLFQTGVDAGPARVACDGSYLTLRATPIDPPAEYMIQWEDSDEPGVFLVVEPEQTTTYRVFLTDLLTDEVYEDEVRVLVHPGSADLFLDGFYDIMDTLEMVSHWGQPGPGLALDPDGDGATTILDTFYLCDFDLDPPNAPPNLEIGSAVTTEGDTVIIPYTPSDPENQPLLLEIDDQPAQGFAFFLNGNLRYSPNDGFVGDDFFSVTISDGLIVSEPYRVDIKVIAPDTFADLYQDIFFVRCWACHIDTVSGGLSLASYEAAQMQGDSGDPGFVPGFPELSPIYIRTRDGEMPPAGQTPLTPLEIERIRLWILRGADP